MSPALENGQLHPYIQEAVRCEADWQSPGAMTTGYSWLRGTKDLPTQDHTDWWYAFENGDAHIRSNLAEAWIWSYAVKYNLGDYDHAISIEACALDTNARFIQAIESYVKPPSNPHDIPLVRCKSNLFTHKDHVNGEFIKALWFGTEQEKLAALLELARVEDDDFRHIFLGEWGSHNRLYEASLLPSATAEHKIAVAFAAAELGANRSVLHVNLQEDFERWRRFGHAAARIKPTGREEVIELESVVAFVKSQPVAVALPVFVKLARQLINESYSLENLSYPFAKNKCYVLDDENVFEVLNYWFPMFTHEWNIASSIGLDFVEAASHALECPSADRLGKISIPDDLDLR